MTLALVLSVTGLGVVVIGVYFLADRFRTRRVIRELTGTLERPDEEVEA